MVRQTLCIKMADKYHQHFRGGIVGKWQKFRPFSNNLLWLFENGRKQTINHVVMILLENSRNFCRFLTTTSSCWNFGHFLTTTTICMKTAENKPTTGFRPLSNNSKCFGHFPTYRFRPFSNNIFRPFSTSPLIFDSTLASEKLKIFFDPCLPTPFFGGSEFFTHCYFGFEKEGLSAIYRSF